VSVSPQGAAVSKGDVMRHLREQVGTAAPQELRRLRDCARRGRKKDSMCDQTLVFKGITLFCINEQGHSDKGHLFHMNTVDCDRINALEAENAELKAALQPFASEHDITKIPAAEYAEAVDNARAVLAKKT
jgi:hypothetical protein